MTPAALLTDAFDRVAHSVAAALDGLTDEQLVARPAPDANTIAWLVWHLARVQDDHVADVAGHEQVWTADGFAERFGLPFDDDAIGYVFLWAPVASMSGGDLRHQIALRKGEHAALQQLLARRCHATRL